MEKVNNGSYRSYIPPLLLLLVFLGKGAEGFFIKHSSGSCVIVTKTVRDSGGHYIHYEVELQEKCLDVRAQFRFRKKGALYNEEVYGCIAVYTKYGGPKDGTLFFYYPKPGTIGKIEVACREYWNVSPFNQTSGGSLLNPKKKYSRTEKKYMVYGSRCVSPYKKLTTVSTGQLKLVLECDNEDQRFTFGSVTCDGKNTSDMNCPPNQMIVVNNAFYGGSSEMKTCDYDEDTNCTLDATCYMKGICEGNKNCENVMVDGSAFAIDPCPGKKKYLYVEYQCFNVSKPGIESKGVVCSKFLLQNKTAFPDSQFTSSKAENGHEAHKARLSSDTSWCASCDEKPYLQIDLRKIFFINFVTTLGDNGTENWVRSYQLDYTIDFIAWKTASFGKQKIFPGNTAGYDDAVTRSVDPNIAARAVRFIPVTWYGLKPCMRVEICGDGAFPGRPTNLKIDWKTSFKVNFTWGHPVDSGNSALVDYVIHLTKLDIVLKTYIFPYAATTLFSVTTLHPYTTYGISIRARNKQGSGEEAKIMFTTNEAAPTGPPLDVNVTAENSSSLLVSWKEPILEKQNGIIVSYTVCTSLLASNSCLSIYTTTKKKLRINELIAYTKYYVKIRASTKVGSGPYSHHEEQTTKATIPRATSNCSNDKYIFYVDEGSALTCLCNSMGGKPTPSASWTKDGVDGVINGAENFSSMLTFNEINASDTGIYTCRVEILHLMDEIRISISVGSLADKVLGDKGCSGMEWYISIITLCSGVLIGVVISYIIYRMHQRVAREKDSNTRSTAEHTVPGAEIEGLGRSPVYEELNLKTMCKDDSNQHSAIPKGARDNRVVEESGSGYQDLSEVREKGDEKYQSLPRVD